MKRRSLRQTQIIYSIVIVLGVILLSVIISSILLRSLRNTTESKISYFVAADAHQMELNVDNYLNSVQQVTTLMFADKDYYLYDATDESLSEYQKIQMEEKILNRIVELGMINNFCDFGIVYSNDKTAGWISQVTGQMFKEGGIYSYFSALIPDDNLKEDAWTVNVLDNHDRIYYVKRLNPNAICLLSFYISELDNVLVVPGELSDMTVRLVTMDNYIVYSSNSGEEAGTLDPGIVDIIGDEVGITAINDDYLITSNRVKNGWKVICSLPVESIMAEQVEATKTMILIVSIVTLVMLGIMLFVTRRLNTSVNVVVDDLDYQAKNDQMTGLLNKSAFRNLTESDLQSYNGKQAIVFIMFDLDNFKQVNDKAGHKVGDEVIRRMGELLREVYGVEGAFIGRIGGDEFAVYKSYNDISREEAEQKIHDLTESLYDLFKLHFQEECEKYGLTVSSGVLVAGAGDYKFDDIYQKADVALYISKRNGKSKPTYI